MENLNNLIQTQELVTACEYDLSEWEQKKADIYNNRVGSLKGYDCPVCKNKGDIAVVVDGDYRMRDCKCAVIRRSMFLIKKSGLQGILDDCTFDKYQAKETWQQTVKNLAIKFVTDNEGKWFYIGGTVGAGKTHICTAIVGELLKQGKPSRYMLWRDDVVKLKALVNYAEEYQEAIQPFKDIKVLYIDDFLKTKSGEKTTTGDINVAFEILNYRYVNKDLITIISSEMSIDRIMEIDMAVGSRIYQRSKEYPVDLGNDKSRNQRLR